jgi:penicillin-binding protein 1C
MKRAAVKRAAVKRLVLAVAVVGLVVGLDRAFPPDLSRLAHPGGMIRDPEGRVLALRAAPGGVWRFATRAEDVSPIMLRLLVAVEDRRFYEHPGVDPLAAVRAVAQAVRAGHVVSGGSTLTMQVARLLAPKARTFGNKLIECVRALQLTERSDKTQVLGMWLSLAPFGGNLVGVEAASRAYFGKDSSGLDAAEAALLVALPRRPEALRPDLHPAAARLARDRILLAAGREGLLSKAEVAASLAEPVPTRRLAMPDDVPLLFARRGGDLVTTIELPLQEALAGLAREELAELPGNVSLAVMIVDMRERAVIAAFPGDAGNVARAGEMDLTRAVRSPGSALKPFLYALSFEDGLAGPETLLPDAPERFGFYAPEDFSHRFSGRVSAAEALRRSLNLPAVTLLARYGPERFFATLRGAGLRLPEGAAASLPVILGGAGITLDHLLALYAALGTDGRVAALRYVAGRPAPSAALLSPAAAEAVAAILTRPFPGGGPAGIAWKTGTSAGNRDSWALGFDRRHAVGVWIGRPDGSARAGKAAADVALPVLARVFGLLKAAPRPEAWTGPASAGQAGAGPAGPAMLGAAPAADPLCILSPPAAAALSGEAPIVLRAGGGRRPLSFLVNGAPIPSVAALRAVEWQPPSPGFYRVTVLDAAGHAAETSLRVVAAAAP